MMFILFCKKEKNVLCTLCIHWTSSSHLWESAQLSSTVLLSSWALGSSRTVCVFPSQSLSLPSLPHRKQKAPWAWAAPVSATSSSTDLACWLLTLCAMCLWCQISFFLRSCLLLWERVTALIKSHLLKKKKLFSYTPLYAFGIVDL